MNSESCHGNKNTAIWLWEQGKCAEKMGFKFVAQHFFEKAKQAAKRADQLAGRKGK